MPSWHVYMVRCADDSLYTGCTNDLQRRVDAHNAGKGARYTRSRRPVQVVWSVRVKDKSAALSREAKLKQLSRAEKLALVEKRGARRRPAPGGKVPQ
jgi:putative endonuclease